MANSHKQVVNSNTSPKRGIIAIIVSTVVVATMILIFGYISSMIEKDRKAERDEVRKTDIVNTVTNFVDTMIEAFGGKFPTSSTSSGYTREDFIDPDGTPYTIRIERLIAGHTKQVSTFTHSVYVVTPSVCDGNIAKYSNNSNDYSIMYFLESGKPFCYSKTLSNKTTDK